MTASNEFSSNGSFSQSPTTNSTPGRFLALATSIILGVMSIPVYFFSGYFSYKRDIMGAVPQPQSKRVSKGSFSSSARTSG